jgi:hypothetical protein
MSSSFNEDLQQVIEQDNVETGAINDALEHNQEIQSYSSSAETADDDSLLSSATLTHTGEKLDESEGTTADIEKQEE